MVLPEPLHHRVRTPAVVRATTSSPSQTKQRRIRTLSSKNAANNEGILLVAALLATVGLCALTISLGIAVYNTSYHHRDSTISTTSSSSNNNNNNGETVRTDDDRVILPWNPKYQVPHSYETVGDRSDNYVLLRKEIDAKLPYDPQRSLNFIHSNHMYLPTAAGNQPPQQAQKVPMMFDIASSDTIPYDIYDCPNTPPPNYPFAWKLVDRVLSHWKVNDMKVPDHIHQGLCVFDYDKDYDKAINYRMAELPFIVINDPQVAASAERWNQPNYMERLLGDVPHRTEYSENNHFMYFIPISKKQLAKQQQQQLQQQQQQRGLRTINHNNHNNIRNAPPVIPKDWKEPTKLLRMPYAEWLRHANTTRPVQPDEEHWYYRLIGCGEEGECDQGSSEYLFDELPFFQPKPSLYIVEPEEQKGIHCRFGMSGVIAENHFDASRNAITVLSGSRRYILTHPNQCANLALLPKGHPSARHSAVDWTNPDLTTYPEFAKALSNEVVLTAGQVLYLPTDWFHFIVSLELNFQCNTRSGITEHYKPFIERCGF